MSRKSSVDKQVQILTAAEKLIAESGFQGLSMQKVANEAGVAAGTIYRYFSDKEDLLNEVRLHVAQRIATAVQAGVNDEMPLEVRFRTMWLNIWNLASSNMSALSNRVQYESLPVTNDKKTRELEREMFAQVERLFTEGQEQGVIKQLDSRVLFVLSFEASVTLSRKHALGFYQLDDAALDAVIEASWDAIINH
ncbi:TetR/AcrR family transcriptional regulator [Vibrio sinensis]|uniref:TetR/AcrR family transcriptional regulator n=1 Tax=Vibrio sinensis TaxID=2302434 RepID=A0A3A6QFB6_9VIBR|nr:TetR/AcrR family transcriptional regulator [Vibrio sinensis]RJX68817.1 TetR/AcrR family transcriptional regulator [Vibrio sinensis]